MRRTPLRALAVATASLMLLAGTTITAQAGSPPDPLDDVVGADAYEPGLLRAMERDLGMPAERAVARLGFQSGAAAKATRAAKTLDSFAGAWVHPERDVLYVAVADKSDRAAAVALGATVVTATYDATSLDAWKATLDTALAGDEAAPALYVDPVRNSVVVEVLDGAEHAARAAVDRAVDRAGIPADAVTYAATDEAPRTFVDVIGGNAYYIAYPDGTARCSVGFVVGDGFVTAGHCGTQGLTTTTPTGTFAGSSFPGNDYAYVRVASGNTLIGGVNNYAGSTVNVAGSTPAAVGATVCRSGSTTGWHCGTIQAFNATVSYAEDDGSVSTVSGLIRTDVCAERGDSGGSLIAGDQAQGLTSGGNGDCNRGGTTYFQPVNEALNAYGVTLRTGGGGTTPPSGACTGYESTRTGSLSAGAAVAVPSTTGFAAAAGTLRGCLDGPTGTDFDLYLQRKGSGNKWTTVAQGITTNPDETVTYAGSAGTYRWVVESYTGSGSYTVGYDTP